MVEVGVVVQKTAFILSRLSLNMEVLLVLQKTVEVVLCRRKCS